ncbi:hypothetical protein P3U08_11595 [Staphylococcus pseudintermedius]|uniref:hypothetical protein n=1 Tax=Staphylococcus pseudintermedius TaxID=283734 RepID=UPI002AFB9421|nr:hypothetical protein [Staphylococcus pseudintermedius]EIK0300135.1 hypothetical protein [Staphylococcus pseudintermedius]EMC0298933.1 hypothetical protein [Staphylococcus pseudintermedius]WQJ39604.1 hypothetical protein P3U08_11595 [Staphylococcus pseudintermedius]
MKILTFIEKYLVAITVVVYILIIVIFGLDNAIVNFLKNVIENKNDIILNIASIFIGMYISLILMYPTFIDGGGLDKLSNKNYLISMRYLVVGLTCSFLYILNFLLEGILYEFDILNCFLLILMFISFIRVVVFVIFWLVYDIFTKKITKQESIDYNKKIYEKIKNIEDLLTRKNE